MGLTGMPDYDVPNYRDPHDGLHPIYNDEHPNLQFKMSRHLLLIILLDLQMPSATCAR